MRQQAKQPKVFKLRAPKKCTRETIGFPVHAFRLFRKGLIVVFCLYGLSLQVLSQINGKLIDAKNQKPVAFATLQLESAQFGTISAIDGSFVIPDELTEGILRVSCLGYIPVQISISNLLKKPVVKLTQQTITLKQVNVFPSTNPALLMMQNVVKASHRNNPEETINYTCMLYHKMVFQLDTHHSFEKKPGNADADLLKTLKGKDLMLIESVSQKKHMAPDHDHENIISGRVSGFKDPILSILPSQLQPFTFYKEKIKLLDNSYLNPVSEKGLEKYIFLLEDTIIEHTDTIYHLSFTPRNKARINGLSGFLHVEATSLAIKNISATTLPHNTPIKIRINQNYSQPDGKHWFPSQLESTLTINLPGTSGLFGYPLIASAKSMVSAVDLEAELSPSDFPVISFEDNSDRDQEQLKQFRYQPLSARDSATYHFIDSIGQTQRFDKIISLQKNLMKGFVPVGPFLLELKHLIGYTDFEGLKLGMGLYTGNQVSRKLSLGGFYNHTFNQHAHNYGTDIQWILNENRETRLSVNYTKNRSTTGFFSFLEGPKNDPSGLFKTLTASTMDKTEDIGIEVQSRFLKFLRARIFYNNSKVTPVMSYPFYKEEQPVDASYSMFQSGVKLRWNQNERLKKTGFGFSAEESPWPTVCFNLTIGGDQPSGGKYLFQKYEARITQTFSFSPSSKTTFQLTGGTITGSAPNDRLYSYFGTFLPFSIEVPFMFATMAPNEFAADQFSLAFIRHQIPLRPHKPGTFKPELILTTNAGWGNLSHSTQKEYINTFNKGFYESGIYLYNLFSQLFFKYGIAVHYRYGPYQKPGTINNLSFRLGLEFSL